LFLFVVIVNFQLTYFLLLQLSTGSILLYHHRCSLEKSLFRYPSNHLSTPQTNLLLGNTQTEAHRTPVEETQDWHLYCNDGVQSFQNPLRANSLSFPSSLCTSVHTRICHIPFLGNVGRRGWGEGRGLAWGWLSKVICNSDTARRQHIRLFISHAQYPLVENA
jgi:hypothetical protein